MTATDKSKTSQQITKEAAGQKWPFDKPSGWDRDAARLLALIQLYPMMWLCLPRAKYIELRIDTRDCGFNLYDRDHKALSPDQIVKAIEDLKAQFGDDGTTASREYREGSRPEEPLLAEIARIARCLAMLTEARGAIASLDPMALGGQHANHPEEQEWYFRDELLSRIDAALAPSTTTSQETNE